jgi:Na+-transporting NADH:ubiquinone oxidoreductase subunit NqrB
MQEPTSNQKKIQFVIPSLRDPRITVLAANSLWIILGYEILYFNRSLVQIFTALGSCAVLDLILAYVLTRKIVVPLSGLLTGLSIGLLLASYNTMLFLVVAIWSIASKHLIKVRGNHVFNPSNFGIVCALLLTHGIASVAPGSQWGGDFRYAAVIFTIGLITMWRIKRLQLVVGWLLGFVVMALFRMAVGQGGLIFALGPLSGAELALFTFVMIPDPKTTPAGTSAQAWFGLGLGVLDGIFRLLEIRYSMFYALFILCALRPWFGLFSEKILNLVPTNGALRVLGLSRANAE